MRSYRFSLLSFLITSVVWADEPQKGTIDDSALNSPRQEYLSTIEEYRKARQDFLEEISRLTTNEEKLAYSQRTWPVEKRFVDRFLILAQRNPQDPTAFDALAWVVIVGFMSPKSEAAAEILVKDYGRDGRLWLICQEMRRAPRSPALGVLLRGVSVSNPDPETRGRACLDLAQFSAEQANFVRLLKTPGITPWEAMFYSQDRLASFRAIKPEPLEEDAIRLYRRVLDEFADVVPLKWWTTPRMTDFDPRTVYKANVEMERGEGVLVDQARPALEELLHCGIGMVAREIECDDVDGKHFKLSEYRGKVVVLTFSGTWCGPCQAMYPHQREIVTRLRDKPFVLLSVMTDEKAEPIQEAIRSDEITWRCWWERGGPRGEIPSAWNIHKYPTVYVLDPKGVIRLKFSGLLGHPRGGDVPQPSIDQFLDKLLKDFSSPSGRD